MQSISFHLNVLKPKGIQEVKLHTNFPMLTCKKTPGMRFESATLHFLVGCQQILLLEMSLILVVAS